MNKLTIDPKSVAMIQAAQDADSKAGALHARYSNEAGDAQRQAEALAGRLRGGDETVTAGDLTAAHFSVTRAELLLDFAARGVQGHRSDPQRADWSLAEALASILRAPELYGDMPVTLTIRSDYAPPKKELPHLVVTRGDEHQEGGGLLAGAYELKLFSPSKLLTAPPSTEIDAAIAAHGWIAAKVTRRDPVKVAEGMWLHGVAVTVTRGWADVPDCAPIVSRPRHSANRGAATYSLGEALAEDVAAVLSQHGATLTAHTARMAPLSSEVSGDAEAITYRLSLGASADDERHLSAALAYALDYLKGLMLPRVGLIVACEPTTGEPIGQSTTVHRMLTVVRKYHPEPEAIAEDVDSDDYDFDAMYASIR